MTIPTTSVTFSSIQNEFGGSTPINLSEYYRGGVQVPTTQGDAGFGLIDEAGDISVGPFRNQTAAGEAFWASPGTYSFTVPAGVTTLNTMVIGGGGGGGANNSSGDQKTGGGGSSGAFVNQETISVTPGETLTVRVGSGGARGYWTFNGNPMFPMSGTSGTQNGANGQSSYVRRGLDALKEAPGGNGGTGHSGGPAPASGAPVDPNGNGGDVPWPEINNFYKTLGGANGSLYGIGGDSNQDLSGVRQNSVDGSGGFVWVGWGGHATPFTRTVGAGTLDFPDLNVQAYGGGTITFQFTPVGRIIRIYEYAEPQYETSLTWFSPLNKAAGAFYWIRVTPSSNPANNSTNEMTGNFGNWVSLRQVIQLQSTSLYVGGTVTFAVEIADSAAGTNIVSTGSITIDYPSPAPPPEGGGGYDS